MYMETVDRIKNAGWDYGIETAKFEETGAVVAAIWLQVPQSKEYRRITHPFRASAVYMRDMGEPIADDEVKAAVNTAWFNLIRSAGRYIHAALDNPRFGEYGNGD